MFNPYVVITSSLPFTALFLLPRLTIFHLTTRGLNHGAKEIQSDSRNSNYLYLQKTFFLHVHTD